MVVNIDESIKYHQLAKVRIYKLILILMNDKIIFNCFVTIIVCVFSLNAQTTIELFPEYDAAIGFHDNFNNANMNYGMAIQNAAYTIPGTNGGLNVNRALLYFNLSNIPSGSSITSAKLNLYALGQSGTLSGHTGQNNNAVLQRVTEDWLENTVTWNSQPATTIQNEVYLPASTSALQDYIGIDVTLLVQDMIANNNFGLLLKLENENASNALLFCSSNYSNVNKHPKLEVNLLNASGINESKQNSDLFTIYPNPNSGLVNFKINSIHPEEEVFIELFSSHGIKVKSMFIKNMEEVIHLEYLESGIYFMKLILNNQTITEKLTIYNN